METTRSDITRHILGLLANFPWTVLGKVLVQPSQAVRGKRTVLTTVGLLSRMPSLVTLKLSLPPERLSAAGKQTGHARLLVRGQVQLEVPPRAGELPALGTLELGRLQELGAGLVAVVPQLVNVVELGAAAIADLAPLAVLGEVHFEDAEPLEVEAAALVGALEQAGALVLLSDVLRQGFGQGELSVAVEADEVSVGGMALFVVGLLLEVGESLVAIAEGALVRPLGVQPFIVLSVC